MTITCDSGYREENGACVQSWNPVCPNGTFNIANSVPTICSNSFICNECTGYSSPSISGTSWSVTGCSGGTAYGQSLCSSSSAVCSTGSLFNGTPASGGGNDRWCYCRLCNNGGTSCTKWMCAWGNGYDTQALCQATSGCATRCAQSLGSYGNGNQSFRATVCTGTTTFIN